MPASLPGRETAVEHVYEALIVGAGGAGLMAALELARAGVRTRRADQALSHPLPYRRRPGRHRRRARQPGRRPLGMAHVRHRQGRRLPGRPGRGRDPGREAIESGHRARAHGPAVQPHAGRADRPAALRRPHPQLRRGAGAPRLLRGRPHRPHDPPDPLPAVHQDTACILRRISRPRPARGRQTAAAAAWSPFASPTASSTSSTPRRCSSPRAASGGCSRSPPTPTRSPATASRWPTAAACRWRTWSSSSSTRPASTGMGILSPRRPAARAASAQRQGRAVHGALRADADGPGPARHGLPRDLHGDPRRPRASAARTTSTSTCATWAAQGHRGEAARHHRLRPHLPGRRADHRAGAHPADRPLRDGRHPHRHRRPGRDRRGNTLCPASTRPANAPASPSTARTAWAPTRWSTSRLRPARRPGHGRRRPWRRGARRCRPARRAGRGRVEALRGRHEGENPAAHPARAGRGDDGRLRRLPRRGRACAG